MIYKPCILRNRLIRNGLYRFPFLEVIAPLNSSLADGVWSKPTLPKDREAQQELGKHSFLQPADASALRQPW